MTSFSAGDAEAAPRGLALGNLAMRGAQAGVVGGALGAFLIQVRPLAHALPPATDPSSWPRHTSL